MTTTSLEFSKLLHELLGDFETEKKWVIWHPYSIILPGPSWQLMSIPEIFYLPDKEYKAIDAPNFAELLRLMQKIGEKMKWSQEEDARCQIGYVIAEMTYLYVYAPTESEAMLAVEKYLTPLLKKV
jgi:hypothetical protein